MNLNIAERVALGALIERLTIAAKQVGHIEDLACFPGDPHSAVLRHILPLLGVSPRTGYRMGREPTEAVDGTTRVEAWLLHSPYPDGTWRGVEKSASGPVGDMPLLFAREGEAQEFAASDKVLGNFYVPVPVILEVPAVRQPLDAVTK